MATVTVPAEGARGGLLRRPTATTGFWSWITTVDHKRIGILYGITAFGFFLIGGIEALFIRLQLAQPNGKILFASTYNKFFTMPVLEDLHGERFTRKELVLYRGTRQAYEIGGFRLW